ncbi:unnamed protein product [Malus baccata var. baccata]
MEFWDKMIFPVRRLWLAVSTRVKDRKNGGGLLKLHDDVQSCGYQDVQVMWQMLSRETTDNHPPSAKRKHQRPFWRVFEWSSSNTSSKNSAL